MTASLRPCTAQSKLLCVGDRLTYAYHFGNHWAHLVKVISVEPVEGIDPSDGHI